MSAFLAVGCYSRPPRSEKAQENALFIIKLDLQTGSLKVVSKYNEVQNISFFSSFKDHLFAVTEDDQSILHRFKVRFFEARSLESGEIERTPVLELEKSVKFDVAGACFVSNDEGIDGNLNVAVACYDDGVAKLFQSSSNNLEEVSKEHEIKLKHFVDSNSERQEAPHAHCILPWKGKPNAYALVDLGADRIYQLTASQNSLSIDERSTFEAPPRSGPRHLIFHPSRPLAFLITELSNELYILSNEDGKLSIIKKYPLIGYPEDTVNSPTSKIQNAAHISLSYDGDYILCSNRGKINNIVVFKLDQTKADAQFIQSLPTGEFPRYFEIVDDRFVVVANQKSHTLVVYSFNKGHIDSTPLYEMSLQSPIAIHQIK